MNLSDEDPPVPAVTAAPVIPACPPGVDFLAAMIWKYTPAPARPFPAVKPDPDGEVTFLKEVPQSQKVGHKPDKSIPVPSRKSAPVVSTRLAPPHITGHPPNRDVTLEGSSVASSSRPDVTSRSKQGSTYSVC